MKHTRLLLILFLAVGVTSSCSKLKESPDPSTTDSGDNGGGGGGNTGDPEVYIGLWKLTDKTVGGTSIFGSLDSIPEVKLEPAGTATWNWYKNGNLAGTESDIYSLDKSSNPVTVTFTKYGVREVIDKTGSEITWKFDDPSLNGAEAVETYTKQ